MDRVRKAREPGSGQSLIAREDEPVAVRFVGVDGVFVQGAGTPAVVTADSVDVQVDTDIDEIPHGKLKQSGWRPSIRNFCFPSEKVIHLVSHRFPFS